jgi:ATP-binding cassette subfamily C protein
MRTGKGNFAQSELGQILAQSRAAFIAVAVISAVLNVLMLAGSIFMMLVYDSVLPSRSVPTLVGLLIMIVVVYLFQGVFDVVRGRMLSNVGATVDRGLGARIHEMIGKMALRVRSQGDGLQPVRDLDNVRTFLASAGPPR